MERGITVKLSELDLKKELVIEQLMQHGYTDTDGYTYKELKNKLTVARALEVDNEASAEQWF